VVKEEGHSRGKNHAQHKHSMS